MKNEVPGRGCASWVSVLLVLWVACSLPAWAQQRGVALVIGNSAYGDRALANAGNDARDMAAVLREAGFQVMERTDLNESAMKEALAEFEDRLRARRGVGLFYFAGHGMQTGRGRNYLLPVGRNYNRERDVELFGVAADTVLASMEKVGNTLNIVILDACRDAPMPAESRSVAHRGLARMDAPSGSVIAFATAPGRTASDSPGRRNGLYTHHLLLALRTPGLRLEDVFKTVGRAVEHDSGGQQSPEEFMKLRDPTPFCFFEGRGCGPGTRLQSAEEVEQEYWDAIKTSRDSRDFRDYLQRFPSGRFTVLAQRQFRLLEPASQTSPPSTLPMPGITVPPSTAAAAPVRPVLEKVTFAADTYFNARSSATLPQAQARLAELAAKAQGINLEVLIAIGHASPDEGTAAQVRKLSVERAESVKGHLVRLGLEKNRIYTEGRGAQQPVESNATAEGRARNRRVEMEVVGTRVKS